MPITIFQQDAPVLRGMAAEVPAAEITSKRVRDALDTMRKAMASQDDAVAIAAPQVGVPLRIFLVSEKILDIEGGEEKGAKKKTIPFVYINPELSKLSREKKWMEEGCLSVRWLYGDVRRSAKATVEAYDEHGRRFTYGASGLLAQIYQHETDHLNGILFIDKAKNIRDLPPEKAPEHVEP